MGRFFRALLASFTWLYLLASIAVAGLIYWGTDRWWLATVVAFGPRWLMIVPLALLLPWVLFWRRRLLWLLGIAAIVLVVPILGFKIPVTWSAQRGSLQVRVLTFNVAGGSVDPWRLRLLLTRVEPDVVLLQECANANPDEWPEGWSIYNAGPLVVASPHRITPVGTSQDHYPPSEWPPIDSVVCDVETPRGTFHVCDVHLRTPREGLSQVLDRSVVLSPARSDAVDQETADRDAESRELRTRLREYGEPILIAGDFNMPCESAIFRRHWGDLSDAFSQRGWGFGYTKNTSVGPITYGTRIDHILASPTWSIHKCWVGPDIGSDHLPLIAELSENTTN